MRVSEAVLQIAADDEGIRDAALGTLLADKAAAVSALTSALGASSSMPAKRFVQSVRLVSAFGGTQAVPVLLDALDRGTLGLDERGAVADALADLVDARHRSDARLKRHALVLSKELLASVRKATVAILTCIGDVDAEARLSAMAAADSDPNIRRHAADAVALLRAHRAQATPPAAIAQAHAGIPEGGLAIDFEAMLSGASSSPASSSSSAAHPDLPAGGMVFDLEQMVGQHTARVAAAGPVAPPAPPLDEREVLLQRLREPRWIERQKAVDAVVARGKELVPQLIERLGPDTAARMGICLALSKLQAPEAASSLLMVATSDAHSQEERDLQAVALKALAHSLTGTEEGIAGPLLPLLKSPDPFVRAGAIVCLGRLADRIGARAAAVMLASDPDVEVKKAAAIAISESVREDHTELVLPLLATLSALPSPPAEGVEAILIALTRIDLDDVAVRVRVRHRVRRLVFGMTAAQRRLAITVLDRCYDDVDLPPVWVIDDVLNRLGDKAADVRIIAAAFIARFLPAGHPDAVRRLEDALDRGERSVSLMSCDALRRHDTAVAHAALTAATTDPDEAVAAHAQALVMGFTPRSSEWTSSKHQPAGAAIEPPSTPSTPASRRVRAASGSAGDVVMAKDGADESGAH
jgi:HEAT repeat protein